MWENFCSNCSTRLVETEDWVHCNKCAERKWQKSKSISDNIFYAFWFLFIAFMFPYLAAAFLIVIFFITISYLQTQYDSNKLWFTWYPILTILFLWMFWMMTEDPSNSFIYLVFAIVVLLLTILIHKNKLL